MIKTTYDFMNPEVFSRIANLEIRARKIVEGYLTGVHKSPFIGNSIEFANHREYVPGDDIKHLDWKVWGRSDKWFIKQYEDETNLTCQILLDVSNSMAYGEDKGVSKFLVASTIAAALSWLMSKRSDSVGLTAFDNEVRNHLPPHSSSSHIKQLFHLLSELKPSDKTDIYTPMHFLAEAIHKRSIVVLVSDIFVKMENLKSSLEHFKYKGHEVIVIQVMHGDELKFPFDENVKFKGLETYEEVECNALSLKKAYLDVVQETNQKIKKLCRMYDFDHILVSTDDNIGGVLAGYINFRQRLRSQR